MLLLFSHYRKYWITFWEERFVYRKETKTIGDLQEWSDKDIDLIVPKIESEKHYSEEVINKYISFFRYQYKTNAHLEECMEPEEIKQEHSEHFFNYVKDVMLEVIKWEETIENDKRGSHFSFGLKENTPILMDAISDRLEIFLNQKKETVEANVFCENDVHSFCREYLKEFQEEALESLFRVIDSFMKVRLHILNKTALLYDEIQSFALNELKPLWNENDGNFDWLAHNYDGKLSNEFLFWRMGNVSKYLNMFVEDIDYVLEHIIQKNNPSHFWELKTKLISFKNKIADNQNLYLKRFNINDFLTTYGNTFSNALEVSEELLPDLQTKLPWLEMSKDEICSRMAQKTNLLVGEISEELGQIWIEENVFNKEHDSFQDYVDDINNGEHGNNAELVEGSLENVWRLLDQVHEQGEISQKILTELTSVTEQLRRNWNNQTQNDKERLIGKTRDALLTNIDIELDQALLDKYNQLIKLTKEVSPTIANHFSSNTVDTDKVQEMLMADAFEIITSPTNTPEEVETASQKLDAISDSIHLFVRIIWNLPRDEVKKLDLKAIPVIQNIEDLPASELAKRQDLLDKLLPIIRKRFPKGDDAYFMEYLDQKDANFTITLADDRIIAFFAKENLNDWMKYLDWFIANPYPPIKGLAEATLKVWLSEQSDLDTEYYAVAKPHIKSLPILVETLDCVAFGQKAYKDHYLQCRHLLSENEWYYGKQMSDAEISEIRHLCETKEHLYDYHPENSPETNMQVCRVEFENMTEGDDITKQNEFIHNLMRELWANNQAVMTRYIPDPASTRTRQIYHCVFEQSLLNENEYQTFKSNIKWAG